MQEIQSHRTREKLENAREQEEVKKLRTVTSDSQQDIMAMRRRVKNFWKEKRKSSMDF